MKKIFLIALGLIIISAGVVFNLNNKSQAKENEKMDKRVLVAYFSATGTTKKVGYL